MADIEKHAAAVQAAVMTQYGLVTGSATTQQDAIKWLVAFEASTMAWAVQPILLRSDVPQVRFYAANGLYSQIRSNWHTLSNEQRSHVVDSMWTALANPPMDMDAKRRLCLAIAAAAIQSPHGLPLLVQRAGQVQAAALATPHEHSFAQLWLVSELLKCASDMSDELQLSRGLRDSLTEETAIQFPAILALLHNALTAHTSSIAPAAVAQAQNQSGAAALAATLSACAGWLTAAQCSVEAVQGVCPGLLQGALPAMKLHSEMVAAAFVDFMDAMFVLYTEPSRDIRFSSLASVAHACLRDGPVVLASARGGPGQRSGAEHAVTALVKAIEVCFMEEGWATCIAAAAPVPAGISLSSFPFTICCSDQGRAGLGSDQPSCAGDIVGLGVLMGDLLLQACCLPILAVQHACSHVCLSVAYTPVASRHGFYRSHFYRMEALVHASIAIGVGGPWEGQGPEGEEARMSLRKATLPDCIQDVYPALGLSYVHGLLPLLHEGNAPTALQGLSQVLPAAAFTAPLHSRLESVLYMLLAACPPSGDGLSASLCASDEAERGGTGEAADPGGHEAVLALLLQVLKQEPAGSPPELVCTACKLLLALRGWLGTFSSDSSLRCSTAPPFGPGTIPSSPSEAPSFALVGAADVLTMLAVYLTKGMLSTQAVARGARKIGPATIVSAQALVEGKAEVPEEEEDEENEEGGGLLAVPAGEAPEGVVCAVSAVTLGKMLVSCPLLTHIQGGALLTSTLTAHETAAAQGLPISARASMLERMLEATRHDLSEAQWEGLCKSALGPCVARVTAAAAAVSASHAELPSKEGLTNPALRACITELAVLCKIFTATPADAIAGESANGRGADEGGWLGGGGVSSSFLASEVEGSTRPAGRHIYQWVGEAVWPALDAVLLKAHAVQPAVSVLLYFSKQCVRLFPGLASARLSSIISTAMQLYAAHLYPAAASAVQYALVTLLQGGGGGSSENSGAQIDASMVSAVAGLLVEMTRVTGEAVQRGGAGADGNIVEALRQFYLLLSTCADIVPSALLQAGRPVLAGMFSLVRACFETGSRDSTKAATDYVRRLLGASSAFSLEPLPPALRSMAIEACCDAAAALGSALGLSLTAEAGDDLGGACVDIFTLTVRPQGCGQAIMESLLESVQGVWVQRAGRLMSEAPAGTEARARLDASLAGGQPLEPSGMLSLTVEEHKGLLTHAYELAVTGGGPVNWSSGGHSSSPTQHVSSHAAGARGFGGPPPRLRLLMADYSKLCQRKTTRDALLMFGLRSG